MTQIERVVQAIIETDVETFGAAATARAALLALATPEAISDEMVAAFWNVFGRNILTGADARPAIAAAIRSAAGD